MTLDQVGALAPQSKQVYKKKQAMKVTHFNLNATFSPCTNKNGKLRIYLLDSPETDEVGEKFLEFQPYCWDLLLPFWTVVFL